MPRRKWVGNTVVVLGQFADELDLDDPHLLLVRLECDGIGALSAETSASDTEPSVSTFSKCADFRALVRIRAGAIVAGIEQDDGVAAGDGDDPADTLKGR